MAQYNFMGSSEETKEQVREALRIEWERMPQELIVWISIQIWCKYKLVEGIIDSMHNLSWILQYGRKAFYFIYWPAVGHSSARPEARVVRPYLIWTGGSYSKRGANSWRGDTSTWGSLGNSTQFQRQPSPALPWHNEHRLGTVKPSIESRTLLIFYRTI